MNHAIQVKAVDESMTEKERFWKKHAKQQRESGLSRMVYCREHQLNYDQFGYWEQKWRRQKTASTLLPVKVTHSTMADEAIPKTVCTLLLKQGHQLKIHDKSILPILLSTLS